MKWLTRGRALTLAALLGTTALAACSNDAQVASRNLSTAADNFEINRRIVFINGITDQYLLVIEGLCAQEQTDKKLTVTCKTGKDQFKKHFLGLSNNVTYVSEQLDPAPANTFHYRVVFKPSAAVPSIDVR